MRKTAGNAKTRSDTALSRSLRCITPFAPSRRCYIMVRVMIQRPFGGRTLRERVVFLNGHWKTRVSAAAAGAPRPYFLVATAASSLYQSRAGVQKSANRPPPIKPPALSASAYVVCLFQLGSIVKSSGTNLLEKTDFLNPNKSLLTNNFRDFCNK